MAVTVVGLRRADGVADVVRRRGGGGVAGDVGRRAVHRVRARRRRRDRVTGGGIDPAGGVGRARVHRDRAVEDDGVRRDRRGQVRRGRVDAQRDRRVGGVAGGVGAAPGDDLAGAVGGDGDGGVTGDRRAAVRGRGEGDRDRGVVPAVRVGRDRGGRRHGRRDGVDADGLRVGHGQRCRERADAGAGCRLSRAVTRDDGGDRRRRRVGAN